MLWSVNFLYVWGEKPAKMKYLTAPLIGTMVPLSLLMTALKLSGLVPFTWSQVLSPIGIMAGVFAVQFIVCLVWAGQIKKQLEG